jgi:hypothetical protein
MDDAVLPECYVDTCMIETLVPPNSHYNHQKGSGTVAKKMKNFFGDRFALGIIDKDKKELYYLKEFNLVISKYNLELYKHKKKHHYLILINPAIETFILSNAKAAGISISSFDLPETMDEFRKETKLVNSKKDPRFRKLFKELIKADLDEITLLITWISYLKKENYNADMEVLKKLND